jgi:putative transposase
MGSLRRECLDHMLIHDGRYLQLVVQEYTAHYNQERPHQGIGQRIPEQYALSKSMPTCECIVTRAILGGLHHSYARATNLN